MSSKSIIISHSGLFEEDDKGRCTSWNPGFDSVGMSSQCSDFPLFIDPFCDFQESEDGKDGNDESFERRTLKNLFNHDCVPKYLPKYKKQVFQDSAHFGSFTAGHTLVFVRSITGSVEN
jgi:hypothetical protein